MSNALNQMTSELNKILFPGGLQKNFPGNCLSLMTTTGAKGGMVRRTYLVLQDRSSRCISFHGIVSCCPEFCFAGEFHADLLPVRATRTGGEASPPDGLWEDAAVLPAMGHCFPGRRLYRGPFPDGPAPAGVLLPLHGRPRWVRSSGDAFFLYILLFFRSHASSRLIVLLWHSALDCSSAIC